MPIYQAINALKSHTLQNKQDAKAFLSSYTPLVQEQLIAAIYLGRDHLDHSKLRSDVDLSRQHASAVPASDYAMIIYDKRINSEIYLNTLVQCAAASDFNLNDL
jgi:hypothetical protein